MALWLDLGGASKPPRVEASGTTVVPSPPAPSSSRPAGLIQAGDSKSTCIYVPDLHYDLLSSLHTVEQYTHVVYHCLIAYSDTAATWSSWSSPWLLQVSGYRRWVGAEPHQRTIVIAQSLVPNDVASKAGWATACASGAYRHDGIVLARNLVRGGFGYAVIRLGPEMNGNWNADSLGRTPASWHAWGQCFARTVEAMRSVAGGHFLFDWNVNAGYRPIPLGAYYPGNAYVDMVGIDVYDGDPQRPLPPVGSPERWQVLSTEPFGLDAVYRFARAHGKPLSVPEWGTVSGSDAGDDPAYVQAMAGFVATHDVAYESWFDAGGTVLTLDPTSAPASLGAYVEHFGPGSALAREQAGG